MFEDKTILITGGTGSLGKELTKKLLETNVKKIRIFSREEFKQVKMQSELKDSRLRFLIGDVRDKDRLKRAANGVDIIIHAAALKHIHVAEYNSFEAIKTNVTGSQNVVDVALDEEVEFALGIGTDKAVSPLNTYGATKLLMEKLFVTANNYSGKTKTKFATVRYGNVLGSRGSILPIIFEQVKKGNKITLTDPSMTRFNISMNQAIDLIFRAIKNGKGGEVFIPKLKAYKLETFFEAFSEIMDKKLEIEKISVRSGEKFHESLINTHELRNSYEDDNDYIVFDTLQENPLFLQRKDIKKTNRIDEYSSDKVELLNKNEIKDLLLEQEILKKI
jgi:UDP-N-acetylglucosamine 4,6-dehydratase/5-epimerase